MREILFRAWDGKRYSIGKPEYFDDSVNFRFHHFDIDCDKPVLEQYTGLKDKHGKKIFEGDIIKVTFGDNYCISQISTSVEQFGVTLYAIELYSNTSVDELGNLTYEITKNRKNIRSSIPSGKNVEIIGNTHDNPELLK